MTQRATLVNGTLLPLNNLLADGVYTAPFKLGSEECEVNLIIDSGSSTMAVLHRRYQPEQDMSLKPTALAQEICYGQGGWLGSVIHTQVQAAQLKLTDTPLALVHKETRHTFLEADGIWGLAYHPLNRSYDLSHYLALQHQRQKYTFPWPFGDQAQVLDQRQLQHFKTLISQASEQDIPSCFTLMEQHGLCANRFALLCHRSSIHHASAETRQASLEDDSLNQGILILGGGEEQPHLYDGQFIDIKVVHDRYYNLNLKAVGWHGEDAIPLPPTDSKLEQRGSSNAILDSGASLICLPESLFKRLLQSLYRLHPDAASVLEPFIHELSKVQQMLAEGIPCNQLKLEQWPELLFYLEGEKGETCILTCPADCYWQTNAPKHGHAVFKLMGQLPHWPAQSILGLPLFNPYYVVFRRDLGASGTVRFARKKNVSKPAVP